MRIRWMMAGLSLALLATASVAVVVAADGELASATEGRSLGFNNARQLAKVGSRSYALVWIEASGSRVVVGEASLGRTSFSTTTTVATGNRLSQPALAVRGGTLAVAWVADGRVVVRIRQNGMWLPEETVGTGSAPSLATSSGYLGLVWHGTGESSILFARRALGSRAGWSSPAVLAGAAGENVSFASLAGAGREFIAAWKRGRMGAFTVELARSDDHGAHWTALPALGEGADPAVCVRRGDIWIGYQQLRGGIVVGRSKDDGQSFHQIEVGKGWFAHLSCAGTGVVVSWEQTPYPPQHPDESVKSFGLALVTAGGKVVEQRSPAGSWVVSPTALAVGSRLTTAWIDVSRSRGPLSGSLRVATATLVR